MNSAMTYDKRALNNDCPDGLAFAGFEVAFEQLLQQFGFTLQLFSQALDILNNPGLLIWILREIDSWLVVNEEAHDSTT